MKKLIVLALMLTSLTTSAHSSERWILKNPKADSVTLSKKGISVVRKVNLGGVSYTIVNTPSFNSSDSKVVANSLIKMTSSEEAYPDFKIGLIMPKKVGTMKSKDVTAWHVDRMKFASLPAEFDGKGVVVAVMDTGVDYTHSALNSKIHKNLGEIAENGIDDDNNGYVDDVLGWDFVGKKSDPTDSWMHGTHCAGIVAAAPDANSNAQGIAPGATLFAIRILEPDSDETFLSDTAEAIRYAVNNGANILTNSWRVYKSWGYGTTEENTKLLKESIAYAGSKNAIFVAAAGNETINIDENNVIDPIYPVGYTGLPNLVGVASMQSDDGMSYFSNYGKTLVHVAAPGSDIISTVPGEAWTDMSGTSMATPMVAGLLARALSKGMTYQEAIAKVMSTSEKLTAWENVVTANGVVNPSELLK